MENKKTLIINYESMRSGGIEVNLAYLMQYAIEHMYRVIWLTSLQAFKEAKFRYIIENKKIEKIYLSQKEILYGMYPRINFDKNEYVVMVSPHTNSFIFAENIRKHAHVAEFNHFLLISHFTSPFYYPETTFDNCFLRNTWKLYYKKIANILIERDNVRGFDEKHLIEYEKRYKVKIPELSKKVLLGLIPCGDLNYDKLKEKAKSRTQAFNILACTRFDFPHKGFVIGLIEAFTRLKRQHHELRLKIIGYGEGRNKLEEKINILNENVKNDIQVIDELDYLELRKEIQNSHLTVGLAGTSMESARCGVPTLVVRHYTYKCETYGFIQNSQNNLLGTGPGEEIDNYVCKIIEMSDNEYIDMCYSTLEICKEKTSYDPSYLFEQKCSQNSLEGIAIMIARIEKQMERISNRIKRTKMRTTLQGGYK